MNTFAKNRLLLFTLLLIVVSSALLLPIESIVAYADTTEYSNVLDDLQADNSFDVADYPTVDRDYTIQLIQIAEGTDKSLYVYTYQPSGKKKDYRASSINISLTSKSEDIHNYDLEFCSKSNTLYKYKVSDFRVSSNLTRDYYIISIFRPYDKNVDGSVSGGNKVSEKSFEVARWYTFTGANGSFEAFDVITVTDKFVGYVKYDAGWFKVEDHCNSHFVAFNTNIPIDTLLGAEVIFQTQEFNSGGYYRDDDTFLGYFSKKTDRHVSLTASDTGSYDSGKLFADVYEYSRIQTVDKFIETESPTSVYSGALLNVSAGESLTDEALERLKDMKWVLRFYETETSYYSQLNGIYEQSVFVSDVSLFRLTFKYNGKIYDLGVIDNKQTGSDKPSNTDWGLYPEMTEKGRDWLDWFLFAITVILLLPVLPYIIKAVVWIVTLPFKLLNSILKKSSKHKKE